MVTVAIPFYNAERYLKAAIESVVNQTYKDWHLILIDDGSTDGSLAIAREFEKSDRRIKVYSDGNNKNLGYRLNEISELVTTPFLARMDADDLMHPEKLQKQLDFLIAHPEVDVLGTNVFTIDENDKITGIRKEYKDLNESQPVKSFIHPTVMGKTSWFRGNRYDVNAVRIEDAELWMRTAAKSVFFELTEPLFYYREFGKDYYKKYFKGNTACFYMMKKHRYKYKFVLFSIKYHLMGFLYFCFNLFGKENVLIKSRNQINYQ